MSAKDVADWMVAESKKAYWLYQETVVYNIQRLFGAEYVYLNQNGNLAISKAVLKEFRKLTEDTLVWERGERAWRPRKPHETKRQVDD